jgi:hypothetical protein
VSRCRNASSTRQTRTLLRGWIEYRPPCFNVERRHWQEAVDSEQNSSKRVKFGGLEVNEARRLKELDWAKVMKTTILAFSALRSLDSDDERLACVTMQLEMDVDLLSPYFDRLFHGAFRSQLRARLWLVDDFFRGSLAPLDLSRPAFLRYRVGESLSGEMFLRLGNASARHIDQQVRIMDTNLADGGRVL